MSLLQRARSTLRLVRVARQLGRWDVIYRGLTPDSVFRAIFETGAWGSAESASGPGSTLAATERLRQELPALFQRLAIHSMLDLPCGDFHWLQHAKLPERYVGADIVAPLIERNRNTYGDRAGLEFLCLDITREIPPKVDLILCRDLLVHLSFADIRRALKHFRASGSRYLLTTTFTAGRANQDIATGDWRPLDLCAPPFSLPSPLELIDEGYEDEGGAYRDKSMGLWRLDSLPDFS